MLLSSKFEELDIRQRVLKGRYILQGYKQIDTRGKNILKTFREDNPELYSLPLQQHELRAMIGAGLKAGKNRTKMACVDEESAYLQEMLDGEPVYLDLSKPSARDVVPPELKEKVESMRNPVVQICKAGYGLKRAVFAYEAGRDERILSTGAERVRGTRCVFKYRTKEGYEAFSGFFIDDAFLIGHETAVTEFLEKLENKRADGTPLFTFKEPPALTDKCHCLGNDVRLELHEDYGSAYLSATDYVKYWTEKFERAHGVHLKSVKAPSTAPACGAPCKGAYADSARSIVMAAYWHARMCAPGMLQPCSALARRFTDWTNDEDRRLLHLLAYWKHHATDELELRFGYDEEYDFHVYNDSDYASDPFTRRSTTGAVIMLSGDLTRANLDNVCKQQPRIARSSGDAETRGIDQTLHELLGLAEEHTDITHATSYVLAKTGVPMLEMLEDLGFRIRNKTIFTDAAVALTATTRGHSKIMKYLSKTGGVDLGWLAETIADLGFALEKVGTADNLSDLHTKGVSREVLERLLPRLGMAQGVTRI